MFNNLEAGHLELCALPSFQDLNLDFGTTVEAVIVGVKDIAAAGDGGGKMDGIGSFEVVLGAKLGGLVDNLARDADF